MEEIQNRQNALQRFMKRFKNGVFDTMTVLVKDKRISKLIT